MTRQIAIPDGEVRVIQRVRPDVLALTEYVDRGKREAFEKSPRENGDTAVTVSPAGSGRNQVLTASRVEQLIGRVNAPDVMRPLKAKSTRSEMR